jgi:hypothetical protein
MDQFKGSLGSLDGVGWRSRWPLVPCPVLMVWLSSKTVPGGRVSYWACPSPEFELSRSADVPTCTSSGTFSIFNEGSAHKGYDRKDQEWSLEFQRGNDALKRKAQTLRDTYML